MQLRPPLNVFWVLGSQMCPQCVSLTVTSVLRAPAVIRSLSTDDIMSGTSPHVRDDSWLPSCFADVPQQETTAWFWSGISRWHICNCSISERCDAADDTVQLIAFSPGARQTGERLQELRGHSQQITAMTTFTCADGLTSHTSLITASSDRSLSVSSYNTDADQSYVIVVFWVQTWFPLTSHVSCGTPIQETEFRPFQTFSPLWRYMFNSYTLSAAALTVLQCCYNTNSRC